MRRTATRGTKRPRSTGASNRVTCFVVLAACGLLLSVVFIAITFPAIYSYATGGNDNGGIDIRKKLSLRGTSISRLVEPQQLQLSLAPRIVMTSIASPSPIRCSSGRMGAIDDDYCDCIGDHLVNDERSTAACSYWTSPSEFSFACDEHDLQSQRVYYSRVGDGVFDCWNGADER
jgi:hypothetical protein